MRRRAPKALLLLVLTVSPAGSLEGLESGPESAIAEAHVKVRLHGVRDRVEIVQREDGALCFRLTSNAGEVQELTPEEFAARVLAEQSRQAWWNRLLNITSPVGIAWVGLGLLGQLLFAGRMLVQWLMSERQRRSVVPPVFWWMSLSGASMLLIYFVWRRDIVGVLGQATGWMIYLRNLWLIYRSGGSLDNSLGEAGTQPSQS